MSHSVAGRLGLSAARRGRVCFEHCRSRGFVTVGPGYDRPFPQFNFIPAYLHDHGQSAGAGTRAYPSGLRPSAEKPGADFVGIAGSRGDPADCCTLPCPSRRPANPSGRPQVRPPDSPGPCPGTLFRRETFPVQHVMADSQLEADIRARAETIYLPVGTCRMGLDPA